MEEEKIYTAQTDKEGNVVITNNLLMSKRKGDKEDKIEYLCPNCKKDITEDIKALWSSDKIFYDDGLYSRDCPYCQKGQYKLEVKRGTFYLYETIK